MTTYLGLDIGSQISHYALTDDGERYEQGTLTLEELPALLAKHRVQSLACEYTGRLAEPWALAADASGITAYLIHTVERRALTRLARQSAKTDKRDAEMIAKILYLWANKDRRELLQLSGDLLIDAKTVREAWQLRTMVATVDQLVKARAAAKSRIKMATRVGSTDIVSVWQEVSQSDLPKRSLDAAVIYSKQHYPQELNALLTIPGIGPRTATYLLATLMPAERFLERGHDGTDKTVRNLKRYVGLYPRKEQSGVTNKRAFLVRRGNPRLRALLYF